VLKYTLKVSGTVQMKDIIENRQRMSRASKIRLAWISLRTNGPLWFCLMGMYYAGSALAHFAFKRADLVRKTNDLPGMNSLPANKLIWENWNWSGKGDEWTLSPEWKTSVVRTFIDPYFADCSVLLEIGPGAGRWTQYLIAKTRKLIGIDISETCVAACRSRFPSATFEVGNGKDIASIAPASIDAIWSFDVFVHINGAEFSSYIEEFRRVLKPDGLVIIHHGSVGGSNGGWRSNVTDAMVREFMAANGFHIEKQVRNWLDQDTEYPVGLYADTITIARSADPADLGHVAWNARLPVQAGVASMQ
jgi:SAM-dependent methyltransferase